MLRNAVRIILMAALPARLPAKRLVAKRLFAGRLVPMCLLPMCLLPLCIGCAMCGSQDDYTYAAFGGRWQRDDPINGRVGSAFAPAGAMVVGEGVTAEGVTGEGQTQQPKLNKPEGDDGSPEASDAEEVYGEALSEAEEGKGDGSDSDAVTNAAENGSMTDISAPANSTVGPRRSARSVLH